MTAKLNLFAAAPSSMKAWSSASAAINTSIEPQLAELVKIRASQINGCANCINMHTAEAREKGETEERIYLLFGSRARRTGLDRSLNAALRRTCARECL
jgi:AhpD family alkylhydroperoxidase